MFSNLFSIRAFVIVLKNFDRGSEPRGRNKWYQSFLLRWDRWSRSFSEIQARVSFRGKVLTFIYLDLFSLQVSAVVFRFSGDYGLS